MLEAKNEDLSEFQSKRFDQISIIMLEILNSMPSSEIKKVIESYLYTLNKITTNITVRFSIKSAVKYDRILRVVKEVEIQYWEMFKIKIP